MTTYAKTYTLGARSRFSGKLTGAIAFTDTKSTIEGVKAWARDEATGEYVRVFEYAPEEFVQGEPQSASEGNFETVEDARKWALTAYRWLNKGRKIAA
jgi:predicted mannosyl-3-phosphoglycerate phosphatase (HAD superfamily)